MFISLALFVIVVVLSAMPTSRLTVAADKRMFLYGAGQGLSSRGFCNTCYINALMYCDLWSKDAIIECSQLYGTSKVECTSKYTK